MRPMTWLMAYGLWLMADGMDDGDPSTMAISHQPLAMARIFRPRLDPFDKHDPFALGERAH
jgi:hypothetical protein